VQRRHGCRKTDDADRGFRQPQRLRQLPAQVEPRLRAQCKVSRPTNALALRECALGSMGRQLPHWLIGEDLRTGRLIDPFPAYRVMAINFDTGAWLLYPSREWLPTKVRSAIDFIERTMA